MSETEAPVAEVAHEAAPSPTPDARACALAIVAEHDSALYRLEGFLANGDVDSAKVAAKQIAAHLADLKALIG